MSGQDPNHPGGPQPPGKPQSQPRTLPPQPNQILDRNLNFTPYYLTGEEASRFPGPSTPNLSNNLKHPAEEFPEPRNLFPAGDPIMNARQESGGKPGELTYEQVQARKDVKDLSEAERQARDAKEFSSSPPDALSQGQKKRWTELLTELLGEVKKEEDPLSIRARAELRKLQKLADLAEGKGE